MHPVNRMSEAKFAFPDGIVARDHVMRGGGGARQQSHDRRAVDPA
jgi:hypothetical protein